MESADGMGARAVALARFWSLLAAAASLACGCGYPQFAFADPSPPPDALWADGLVPVDSGTASDVAPTDARASDAFDTTTADTAPATDTVPFDVAPDTTSMPKGCAGTLHEFCDDFDKSTGSDPSVPSWTERFIVGSATALVESTFPYSSPHSMVSALTATSSSTENGAQVNRVFTMPTATTPLRADVWIRLESDFPASYGPLLLKLSRAGKGVGIAIDSSGIAAFAEGLTGSVFRPPSPFLTLNVWHHLRLETVFHTSAGRLDLWIDAMDVPVVSYTGISTTSAPPSDQSLRYIVGLYTNGPTADFRMHFDDVSLDYGPF